MQFLALVTAALLPVFALGAPANGVTSTLSDITTVGHTGLSTITSVGTRTGVSTVHVSTVHGSPVPLPTSTQLDNGACDTLVQNCIVDDDAANSPYGNLGNVFNKWSCVMAFACRAPAKNVNQVLQEMWHSNSPAPTALKEPRLSDTLFTSFSTDQSLVWTQQNFIDTYYQKLSSIGGPYPPNVNLVIGYWSNIAAWTGFCATKVIPYQNLADWYAYSSTVQGAATSC